MIVESNLVWLLKNIFESLYLLLVIINYGVQYGSPETNQYSSLSYVLFAWRCVILISRGFVRKTAVKVANTIRNSTEKTTIDDLKVSLVYMYD